MVSLEPLETEAQKTTATIQAIRDEFAEKRNQIRKYEFERQEAVDKADRFLADGELWPSTASRRRIFDDRTQRKAARANDGKRGGFFAAS